jgi:hypothetical protein
VAAESYVRADVRIGRFAPLVEEDSRSAGG